jgi:substrate import-associated zinc metallohydrolase lipoprotein
MKKVIYALCIALMAGMFASCNEEDKLNPDSIYGDETPPELNEFDKWLVKNYVNPYNVDFKYRLEDGESSMSHTLAPAEYEKSVAMAKLVKHLWFEAYDEARGVEFTRAYTPRIIHLIGSPAYNSEGTIILGTAEGGLKVTLYMINYLDLDNIDFPSLNYYYFKTMHHEFGHILHQTINYDPAFKQISAAYYISGDWYLVSNSEAWQTGFVTPYAMNQYDDDFVETYAAYLTDSPYSWATILANAGAGRAIIEKKFEIVKNYFAKTWGIDIVELKAIIQRRSQEIDLLDLENLN